MKILSAPQIRSADEYTIRHEPVSSSDLMERAAMACVEWIASHAVSNYHYKIFCGPGNNGGDGLAIARLLHNLGFKVVAYVIKEGKNGTPDFQLNEMRLREIAAPLVVEILDEGEIPAIGIHDCVIDALFGTGIIKVITGIFEKVIARINAGGAVVISIDLPSGLFTDQHTQGEAIVQAMHTLSFQVPKLAFMFAENEKFVGQYHILDIGLNDDFIKALITAKSYLTSDIIRSILKPRKKFSHKGNYGHALLVAGSKGKMGAAVLAAKGCLRTGAGLLSVQVPDFGIDIMQVSCPEAMVETESTALSKFSAVGIGPGIGMEERTRKMFRKFLESATSPLVLDADALNIISEEKDLLKLIPANSILTPHTREFERLAGKTKDDFERHELQIFFSKNHKVHVVLKGAHTCITTPEGMAYFNSTGNPGMAKGGSGDVLTGMLTSLLAQGYSPKDAALLGVYLHGLAGDIAAEKKGMDGMIARDLVNAISGAWKKLRS